MLKVVNGKQSGFVGENKIYLGRNSYGQKGSVLQNKFKIGRDGSRSDVVEKYRQWLWVEFNKKEEVYKELVRIGNLVKRGKDVELVCWCKPLACHGDVVKNCVVWLIQGNL